MFGNSVMLEDVPRTTILPEQYSLQHPPGAELAALQGWSFQPAHLLAAYGAWLPLCPAPSCLSHAQRAAFEAQLPVLELLTGHSADQD